MNYKAIVETENGVIKNFYPYSKKKFMEYFECLKEDMGENLAKDMIENNDITYCNKYGDSIKVYALSKEEVASFVEILLLN